MHICIGREGHESTKMTEWIGDRKWNSCCQPIHDPDPSFRPSNKPVMWSTIDPIERENMGGQEPP
jgi:hypothetical protein